jgi:hypothetical protein
MSGLPGLGLSMLERIRHDLVGLKMPRALEALDGVVRRLEQGEIGALEAIDTLLAEELTLRENSRIKTVLRMGRLSTIKTLAGFDFSFQPSPATRSSTSWAHPGPARATWRRRSASRRSRPAAASTSAPWPA